MQNPSYRLAIPMATAETLNNGLCLLGRLLLAFVFIVEGYGKITDYAGVQAYMAQFGVSPSLLSLVILTEFGGGLLVALGIFTRPAAFALGGFCVLAALIFHRGGGDATIGMEKDFAIAGGFFVLAAHGPGVWGLGNWLLVKTRPSLRPPTK